MTPRPLREGLLAELHEQHPAIYRTKAPARSCVWWPGIDRQIEGKVKGCHSCIRPANSPPTAPIHHWTWPTKPRQRDHIDFAEFQGENYFVLSDAHSKLAEVFRLRITSAEKTIDLLGQLFACYGLPEEMVSDNGPQFTSTPCADFMRLNRIRHSRSVPYHPATNGAAERLIQNLKAELEER